MQRLSRSNAAAFSRCSLFLLGASLRSLLRAAALVFLLVSGPSWGAPPTCPGHPSCNDDGSGGDDGGGGEDRGTFDPTACAGAAGVFPAAAYRLDTFKKNGRLDKTLILLTDSLASCEVVVFEGEPGRVGFHFDPAALMGTLVWSQPSSTRWQDAVDQVVTSTFHVRSDNVISTTLPLAPSTVWNGSDRRRLSLDVSLSPDGLKTAFTVEEGRLNEDGYRTLELLVCDLAGSCEPAFQHTEYSGGPYVGGTWETAWSARADQLYFLYRQEGSVFGADLHLLRKVSGQWTLVDGPVAFNVNADAWRKPDFSPLHDDAGSPVPNDCLVLSSQAGDGALIRYQVIEVPHDFAHGSPIQTSLTDPLDDRAFASTWVARPSASCNSGQLWISRPNNEPIKAVELPAGSSAVEVGLVGSEANSGI